MATFKSVEKRLLATAKKAAGKLGFASDCQQDVINLIRNGIQKIETDGLLDNEEKIKEAEANLVKFVTEMKIEAHKLGLAALHENTFARAISKLCPLWPFCS